MLYVYKYVCMCVCGTPSPRCGALEGEELGGTPSPLFPHVSPLPTNPVAPFPAGAVSSRARRSAWRTTCWSTRLARATSACGTQTRTATSDASSPTRSSACERAMANWVRVKHRVRSHTQCAPWSACKRAPRDIGRTGALGRWGMHTRLLCTHTWAALPRRHRHSATG